MQQLNLDSIISTSLKVYAKTKNTAVAYILYLNFSGLLLPLVFGSDFSVCAHVSAYLTVIFLILKVHTSATSDHRDWYCISKISTALCLDI